MNRGGAGARSLNIELQSALNPAGERKVERFGWTFAPGDKVMQIENDYDKEVYNGDIGHVVDVDPETGELTAHFEGSDHVYGFGELDTLVPAYAATVHKSQGSEYPAVIVPVLTQHYAMLRADSPLHRRHAGQAAGGAGGPEEGGGHCGAQRLGTAALVEARRMAGPPHAAPCPYAVMFRAPRSARSRDCRCSGGRRAGRCREGCRPRCRPQSSRPMRWPHLKSCPARGTDHRHLVASRSPAPARPDYDDPGLSREEECTPCWPRLSQPRRRLKSRRVRRCPPGHGSSVRLSDRQPSELARAAGRSSNPQRSPPSRRWVWRGSQGAWSTAREASSHARPP